ncbi:hypothetical protein V7068_08555 [Bacillus sp. JJ634]
MTKPYNEKALTRYLNERPTMDNRSTTLFGIFIFPIPFIIGPLLAPPFHLFYFLLIVTPIILLDIWAGIYRFSKSYHYTTKKQPQDTQYYLIRGIFGCLASLGCFLVTQKYAYTVLQFETPLYFILTLLGYVILLILHFKTKINKLKEAPSKKKNNNSRMNKAGIAGTASALGYLACNLALSVVSENTGVIIFMTVLLYLSIIIMHFILELHRFMLIKKYNSMTKG